MSTRYTADQLVEAVGRARGDGRHFLVCALAAFPGPEREAALTRTLEAELRADDRNLVRAALAELRPEERQRWQVTHAMTDDHARIARLHLWHEENGGGADEEQDRDPTAEVSVDRAMKRLGFVPANPTSEPYDELAGADVAWIYEFDVGDGELPT